MGIRMAVDQGSRIFLQGKAAVMVDGTGFYSRKVIPPNNSERVEAAGEDREGCLDGTGGGKGGSGPAVYITARQMGESMGHLD
jgi:hypothetical protein